MADTMQLAVRVKSVTDRLEGLEIKTQGAYSEAEEFLRKIKDSVAFVTDAFEAERVAAKAAYDKVLEEKRFYVKPLTEADQIVRDRMAAYATEVERERRAREKLERERLQKEHEEQAFRKAEEQAAMGRVKEAVKTAEKAVLPVPKAWGKEERTVKTVTVWDLKITDMVDLLEFLLISRPQYIPYVSVDVPKLVAALKREVFDAEGCKIPGVSITLVSRPVL